MMGHRLSNRTYVAAEVYFAGSGLVTEGVVSINARSFIDAVAPIHIADGVRIGFEVMLVTTTHEPGASDLRAGEVVYKPITIGRGVWIGARATVLPGVSIAPGSVIAAGALVTADTEPNGVYAGVPAKRVKDL
jgi:maltose O-acetyltransferase